MIRTNSTSRSRPFHSYRLPSVAWPNSPTATRSDFGIGKKPDLLVPYTPAKGLFDYQEFFARLMVEREKFAMFARPGLGKTFVMAELALHAFKIVATTRRRADLLARS